MSVDAFGRTLKDSKVVRGPPGVGYKLTSEGDYDLDYKKLCNVADPSESGDAINLKFLIKSLGEISKTVSEIKDQIDNLNKDLKIHRSEIDNLNKDLKIHRSEIDNLNKDLKIHRSEIDENVITLGLRIQEINEKSNGNRRRRAAQASSS